MKILIAGASGFVASALIPFLNQKGHEVIGLVRKDSEKGIYWNPQEQELDPNAIEGFDVVINLAGENVGGFWTKAKKERILMSRISSTETICRAISKLRTPPKVLVNASAIGFYGSQGDEILTEESSQGDDFLADVCVKWERAARSIESKDVRVVALRFGVILDPSGGALAKMLFPFKMGFGAKLGSGRQYMSWVALSDVLRVIQFIIEHPALNGPLNVVAPNPVTNAEYTDALGRALNRPTIFYAPEWILKLFLGEMAEEMFLASTRVVPRRLQAAGYMFKEDNLESYLKNVLSQS